MTINVMTTVNNVNKLVIKKNISDDNMAIWISHDDGDDQGIWLKNLSPEFEIVLNGVQISKQAKPVKSHGFSEKTMDKAITLLKNGKFTRKQIASFTGLKPSSVYSLLTDLGKRFTITRIGKQNKRYSIAS